MKTLSRVTVACIGLVVFAGASCSGSHKSKASSTTIPTTASPPGATTTTAAKQNGNRWLDLRTVDWDNVVVPGRSCLHAHGVRLHNGKALLPDNTHGNPIQPGSNGVRYDRLGLANPVIYGDFEGDGHDDAAVPLLCSNNGGTADGDILWSVAVYTGKTGKPTVLGLITPRQQLKNVLPTLLSTPAIRPGAITVHESWYGPNDMTCCPQGSATARWSLSAGRIVPIATKVTAYPK